MKKLHFEGHQHKPECQSAAYSYPCIEVSNSSSMRRVRIVLLHHLPDRACASTRDTHRQSASRTGDFIRNPSSTTGVPAHRRRRWRSHRQRHLLGATAAGCRGRCCSATAATSGDRPRTQKSRLQCRGVVPGPDSGQVACGRMAFLAAASAIEVGLACLGVAGQQIVEHKDRRTAQRIVYLLMDEVRQIGDLRGAGRLSAVRAAALQRIGPCAQHRGRSCLRNGRAALTPNGPDSASCPYLGHTCRGS